MFLRRFGGPLLSKVKESTGITGLQVQPNAREVLIGLYNKTLDVVQIIPETAQYRKTVEEISRHRLKVVEESKGWEEIEAKLGAGQVEQVIEQAKDELLLIPKMAGGCFLNILTCTETCRIFCTGVLRYVFKTDWIP